jgi:putative hydroxymethylpyrimidine transport system substrate-binding protein
MKHPAVLLIAAAALLIAGCGEKTERTGGPVELEPFTVVLDYFPNADHAPIYAARAAGEFERAGLDVKIQAPPDPAAPLRLLQGGKADLAISYEPEVLLARDKGPRIVSVGALVQKPLTSLMALPGSGVRSAADLRGKTVGTAGIPYQEAYLKTILDRAGIPQDSVKRVNVGFNLVPALLAKRVDATLGAFWNYEGVDLERRGRKPVILRMEELGVPTYNELVFAAGRRSLTEDEGSKVRRFLAAVGRGAAIVRDHPEQAVQALVEANKDLRPELERDVIDATTDTFFPSDTSKPFGWQDADAWRAYGHWMLDNKLIEKDPLADNALTNEFLPGEGLQTDRTQY